MKAKRNRQMSRTTQSVLKVSNEIDVLYQLAKQSKNSKIGTNNFGQKLRSTAQMLQKKLKTLVKGAKEKDHEDYDSYVIEFYENRCKMLEQQIQQSKTQNNTLKEKLNKLQKIYKSYNYNPQNQHMNSQQTVSKFTNVFNSHTQKVHTIGLLQTQSNFTKQQNLIIDNLKNYIKKIDHQEKQNRKKFERKIQQLNTIIESNHKNFVQKMSESMKQADLLMQEIRKLEKSNLKYIEQMNIMDQEIAIRNEQIRILQRNLYDISIQALQIENNFTKTTTSNIQIQENIKILTAQNAMLRQKMETNKCDFTQKLKQKNTQLNNLEQQIKDLIFEHKKSNKQIFNVQKIKDNYQHQLTKLNRQIESNNKITESLKQKISQLEEENYKLKTQIKSYQHKSQKQAKVLKQTIKELRKYESKIHTLEETITQHKYFQYEKQKELKNDICEELNCLITVNQKLQLHNQQLSTQLQELRQKNNESRYEINDMSKQLEKIKTEKAVLQEKNKKLQYANQMLNQKIKTIQQEFEILCEGPSSDDVRINLENQLLTTDRQLKTKQQLVSKLQNQNQQLKQKNQTLLKIIQQIKSKTDNKLNIHNQLDQKQFQNKQLKQKVKILQEQVRQQQKAQKIQEKEFENKIQELESILAQEFSSSASQQQK